MHAASFLPTYPPHTFDPLALSSRDFFPPNHTAQSYMPSAAHAPQSNVTYGYSAYSVEGRFSSTASYANAQPSSMHLPPAGGSNQHYRYSQPTPPQPQLHSPPSLQPVAAQGWQSRPSSVASLSHPSSSMHIASAASIMPPSGRRETRRSPQGEAERAPQAAILYEQSRIFSHGSLSSQRGSSTYGSSSTRLPPILQVEKQTVTTSATQAASASRRRNEANFQCPVPGCGSTFTRRFNLRGKLSKAALYPHVTYPIRHLQVISGPTLRSVRSCANGLGVAKALRASTTASECMMSPFFGEACTQSALGGTKPYTQPDHRRQTSVKVVGRRSAGWTLLM